MRRSSKNEERTIFSELRKLLHLPNLSQPFFVLQARNGMLKPGIDSKAGVCGDAIVVL